MSSPRSAPGLALAKRKDDAACQNQLVVRLKLDASLKGRTIQRTIDASSRPSTRPTRKPAQDHKSRQGAASRSGVGVVHILKVRVGAKKV